MVKSRKRTVVLQLTWSLLVLLAFLALPVLLGGWRVSRAMARLTTVRAPVPLGESLPSTPAPDPLQPVAVVLLSNAGTEITDFLAPYAILAESGAFQVVTVAPERRLSPVWPGLQVVPDFSFADFAQQFPDGADLIVVPFLLDHDNPVIVDWLKTQVLEQTQVLSICEGSRTVASAGFVEGKTMATHFFGVGELQAQFPATQWTRDRRYVEDGNVISSAGVTSGIDATFFCLSQLVSEQVAAATAARIGYDRCAAQTPSPIVSPIDFSLLVLTGAFSWSSTTIGVVLHDGVDEFHLGAFLDAYQRTLTCEVETVSNERVPIRSRHGLWLVPTSDRTNLEEFDRLVVVSNSSGSVLSLPEIQELAAGSNRELETLAIPSPGEAYDVVLQDVARQTNVPLAHLVSKMIEYPESRLQLESPANGAGWPMGLFFPPLLLGTLGVVTLLWIRRRIRDGRTTS